MQIQSHWMRPAAGHGHRVQTPATRFGGEKPTIPGGAFERVVSQLLQDNGAFTAQLEQKGHRWSFGRTADGYELYVTHPHNDDVRGMQYLFDTQGALTHAYQTRPGKQPKPQWVTPAMIHQLNSEFFSRVEPQHIRSVELQTGQVVSVGHGEFADPISPVLDAIQERVLSLFKRIIE